MRRALAVAALVAFAHSALAQDTPTTPMPDGLCDVGCAGSAEIDPCLVGLWLADSNAFADWLRANGVPFEITMETPYYLDIFGNGQFLNPPYSFRFTQTVAGYTGTGHGIASEAYGCWSVKPDDVLNFCYADDTPRMSVTVIVLGQIHRTEAPPRSRPNEARGYECSDETLTLFFEVSKAHGMATATMSRMSRR